MSYNYVVTAQKPTAVNACVTGNLTSPTDLNLLVARVSRLEMSLVTPEGLRRMKEVSLYGSVAKMKLFRPPDHNKDLIFILTARYNAMILEWTTGKDGELDVVTRAHGNVADIMGKPSENGILVAIDPQARVIGLRLYDGLFKIIPLDLDSKTLKAASVRLEELNVYDAEFLHGCAKPSLILIHQDFGWHITTHEINLGDEEYAKVVWKQDNVGTKASILIPVSSPLGGAIVIGQESIVYYNRSSYVAMAPPQIKMTPIHCYCRVDELRYLLGDEAGRLLMLVVGIRDTCVCDLKVELLGDIPIPECMTYLDNGVVFVGSRLGDSALVRLHADAPYVRPMDAFTSLAPIVDMCLVDLERQGRTQAITCSGASKMGSLRVIHSGIDFQEQANTDLPGIKGMWALSLAPPPAGTDAGPAGDPPAPHHDTLVLAFVGHTRVLALSGEELEETEIGGFVSDRQTFYTGNIRDQIIQVTDAGIRLVAWSAAGGWALADAWAGPAAGGAVSAAGVGGARCVCACGARLSLVWVCPRRLTPHKEVVMEHDVACLDVHEDVMGVGLWTDISVRVLRLPDLTPLHTERLPTDIIPRSLLVCAMEGVWYLLVALGDGSMFYFTLEPDSGRLANRKCVTLGTLPALLRSFRSLSTTTIFACSDRPTAISSANHKLVFADVNLSQLTHVCSLNAAAYPDSVALATDGALKIGTIDEIRKLHIRTVPLGESPRRIAHQPASQTFGVLTMRVDVDGTPGGDAEMVRPSASRSWPPPPAPGRALERHRLLLLDDHTFEVLHAHQLMPTEVAMSLVSCRLGDDPNHYYAVGTAIVNPEDAEPKKGRILMFHWREGALIQVAEKEIKGACYALVEFNEKLLAAINSTVRLYEWTWERQLRLECSHFNNIVASHLKVKGDFILVGDSKRSMLVLQYKQMESNFQEMVLDCNPNWMTSVEILDDDTFLGAEKNFNLFVCQKDSATDEERQQMSYVGWFHLGDRVTVMRRGALVQPPAYSAAPSDRPALLATESGAICLVVQLSPQLFDLLRQLQERLTAASVSHAFWRSFKKEISWKPGEGFLDGDLVESFLELGRGAQQRTIAGLQIQDGGGVTRDATVDDFIEILEDLTRIH